MSRFFGMTSLAAISGALMLAGCATTEDVQKAQATANQGIADAAGARMAADAADQKATQAGQMAAQAQAAANTAQQVAQAANTNAQQALATANSAQSLAQAQAAVGNARFAQLEPPMKRHHRVARRVARGERD